MAKPSDKTKSWRYLNKEDIHAWRQKVNDLRKWANMENWSHERLEIEIAQRLPSHLRPIYDFALLYTQRYRTGKFREFMADVLTELLEYGTLEPGNLSRIQRAIMTTKRRMNDKK